MIAKMLGVPEAEFPFARKLGLAMQLTNVLRDVAEDWLRGRIYVPLEDLKSFGIRREEWRAGINADQFGTLMRFEAERNLRLYREAHAGLGYIPRRSRLAVCLASNAYQNVLFRTAINRERCETAG